MQTFVTSSDFDECARVIDPSRLGNQAYRECKTLINGGWKHHPASKMWRGYEHALADYALACLRELKRRGRDYPHWFEYFENKKKEFPNTGKPSWVFDKELHLSHQSNLLRKNKEHYSKYFKGVPDNIPYKWPEA